jgi:hypothetical protein
MAEQQPSISSILAALGKRQSFCYNLEDELTLLQQRNDLTLHRRKINNPSINSPLNSNSRTPMQLRVDTHYLSLQAPAVWISAASSLSTLEL